MEPVLSLFCTPPSQKRTNWPAEAGKEVVGAATGRRRSLLTSERGRRGRSESPTTGKRSHKSSVSRRSGSAAAGEVEGSVGEDWLWPPRQALVVAVVALSARKSLAVVKMSSVAVVDAGRAVPLRSRLPLRGNVTSETVVVGPGGGPEMLHTRVRKVWPPGAWTKARRTGEALVFDACRWHVA